MPPPSEWPTTRRPSMAEHDQQVAQADRVRAQGVVATRLCGLTMAQQVGREDRVAVGELGDDLSHWRESPVIP